MESALLVALLTLTLAIPVFASDGVLEINQTCAVQAGCFAGDGAGFPITIDATAGHSYRLTSDLTIPNENTTGILVTAADVSVDLAGFTLRGPNSCTEPPTSCRFTGTGHGIHGQEVDRVSISNGSVVGMGSFGIFSPLGDGYEIRNVRVAQNRSGGIQIVGAAAIVDGNTALRNGQDGIFVGAGGAVSGNTAYQNGLDGIHTGPGSTISDNATHQNGFNGINADLGSTVSGNSSQKNGRAGISVEFGSTVSGNTTYQNAGDGISVHIGSTIQRNTVRSNAGFGVVIVGGIDSTYRENTITSNALGAFSGSGVNTGNNYCSGPNTVSAACP